MHRRIAALAAALSLSLLAGCVQVPQRVSATADPRPSMINTTATELVERYVAIDEAAWKKLDPSRLGEVSTGSELQAETNSLTMEKRTGGKDRSSDLPNDSRYSVTSTPGGHYPALAVISGIGKGRKTPDSLYLAERASAADPWLISYSTGEQLNTFRPKVTDHKDRTFRPVDRKTKINSVTTEGMTDLVTDALQRPKGSTAQRIVANNAFNTAKAVPLDKKAGAHEKVTYEYTASPWHQAYRSGEGDLIVFGAFTQSIRYDYLDNYYGFIKSGETKKLLPGKYSSFTYTNDWRYAIRVPRTGKLAIQDLAWSRENITGDPYTGE